MNDSPMMRQYHQAKGQCGDALLLFRMGDFYELFFEDARSAAEALGLALTSRDKGQDAVPMAGFPHHQLDSYLSRLIQAGFRVAICDQVEDAKLAKGLVKREVTRLVTPGTLTEEALLDPKEPNFLAAVLLETRRPQTAAPVLGLAWIDVSTGQFRATTVTPNRLLDELCRIRPSECLVSDEDAVLRESLEEHFTVTCRPGWTWSRDQGRKVLNDHFRTWSMEGFGFGPEDEIALISAGAIVTYLQETQRASLEHVTSLVPYRPSATLQVDHATRYSLELNRTMREGSRQGSLIGMLDRTVTAPGARLLSDWLATPLLDIPSIEARHDAIEELLLGHEQIDAVRRELRSTFDLQRLATRVATGRATPRDLECVGRTLAQLPALKNLLIHCRCQWLVETGNQIDPCQTIHGELIAALVDGCPLTATDGGIIRPGYHAGLDDLRELARGGKQWIAEYQAQQQERTGIGSLKVGFNKVFGFYLEVTNAHRDKIPTDYIRKQTLKNAERYITPELKEYEERVLSAEEKSKELEYELFCQLRQKVHAAAGRLARSAEGLARLDVVTALADLARRQNYCRPTFTDSPILAISEGRHPVLELSVPAGTLVPNDVHAGGEHGRVLLITGPNMAGKSTFIRQVALIQIMAQMGSFVPAASVTMGVADRVFARVGASDELARGMSTFMVEMTETARILNTATPRSLVILDEIGRGTSTYDGISLAWSIVEYLHDRIGCRVLFATHFHELTELEKPLESVRNWNVAVREWENEIVFLYKIVPGAADKSYGIHVARLAGVPAAVHRRAQEILTELESDADHSGEKRKRPHAPAAGTRDIQRMLFSFSEHPLLDEIRTLRVDETTPIEALQRIQSWQETLADKRAAAFPK